MSSIKADHKMYLSFLEATAKRETYAVASFTIFTKILNMHTCVHTHTPLVVQKHLQPSQRNHSKLPPLLSLDKTQQ